ncbi:MAG: sensor histidine kinase [Spirochaetaceae bacterium]|nr:sensor histidine kinase [Spirochaetaceae bacterium]
MSPPKPFRPRFTTIRRQLLWSYGVLIIIVFAMVAAFTWLFLDYYAQVDELLSMNAATATISIKLEETHQLLENTINYEDASYIEPYHTKRADLESYIKEYDVLALKTADLLNDYDAYYQFLEIQEIILIYGMESDILLDLFNAGATRYDLYDKLYSLRDLNYRAYELQSALLVRQNNYLRRFYTSYAPVVRHRLTVLLTATLLFVVFSVIWTLRQASAISKPLHELVLMHMDLADGNFRAVRPVKAQNQEIRALGDAFVFMSERLSESLETEKRALIMESSLRQAKLETLQAQINPHFLFNALNAVRSLSQIEQAPKTENMVDALSAFLRYNLEKADSSIALEEECANAEHYLKIQKMRFGERLNYSISVEPEVFRVSVPSLLIQPLIENAIIHGIEPSKDGGSVRLTVRKQIMDDNVRTIIEVLDDGVGMSEESRRSLETELATDFLITGEHVGIRNTWRRMLLVDSGAEMQFLENAGGRGTLVRLSLSMEA